MRALVTHPALAAALAAPALADTLPPTVAVPVPTLTDVIVENYGQTQVKVDDGSDGQDVIVAGKHWTTRLDASKLPGDGVPSGPHWSARCRRPAGSSRCRGGTGTRKAQAETTNHLVLLQ